MSGGGDESERDREESGGEEEGCGAEIRASYELNIDVPADVGQEGGRKRKDAGDGEGSRE